MKAKTILIVAALVLGWCGVRAQDQEPAHRVTYASTDVPGGTISIKQLSGTTFRLTARAKEGYTFLIWSDSVKTPVRDYTHTATDEDPNNDKTLWAVFTLDEDMTQELGHIEVTNVYNHTIPWCYLKAVPNDGAAFFAWNNGDKTENPTQYYFDKTFRRYPIFKTTKPAVVYDTIQHPGGTLTVEPLTATTYSVLATPADGYTFQQWADGKTDNPRTFAHNEGAADSTHFAVFTRTEDIHRPLGDVAVTIDNASTPSFILTATAKTGNEFFKWNNGSDNNVLSYVETDGTRYPMFNTVAKQVVYDIDDHAGGHIEVNDAGDKYYQLEAIAEDGYTFVKWADGVVDNPRTIQFVQDAADIVYYAVFTRDEYMQRNLGHVTLNVTSQGNSTPTYQLTAVSEEGGDFMVWNNGNTDAGPIDYAESEGARYPFFMSTINQVVIDYDQHVGGTVTATLKSGKTYTLTAVAAEGYTFQQWADGETATSREITFEQDAADKLYYAVFTRNEYMTRNLGYSTLAVTDQGNNTPSFQLTAHADDGGSFMVWNNGDKTESIAYAEPEGARYPFFRSTEPQVVYSLNQHPGGVVSVERTSAKSFTLTATPNEGYTFLKWTDDITSATRSYTHPNAPANDSIVYAVFTKDEDVTIAGGTVEVKVIDRKVPSFTLEAKAIDGEGPCSASFLLWTNGVKTPLINYVESDGNRKPIFGIKNPLGYTFDNQEGGVIEVTPLACGFTLTAVPNAGYSFTMWQDNENTEPIRTIDYIEGTYTALFTPAAFKVDDQVYNTFDEAVAAAGTDKPVQLVNSYPGIIVVATPVNLQTNDHTIGTLDIRYGGDVNLVDFATVGTLALQSTTGKSSQIHPLSNLDVNNAYIDIQFKETANDDNWYGFAVPFEVDVETGVARADGVGTHVSMHDYLIWEYDGNIRQQTGTGWVKKPSGTLEPGQFYMIGVVGPQIVWRFTMKTNATIVGSNSFPMPAYGGETDHVEGGWNAMGNSLTQYAKASATGINYCQVYDNVNIMYLTKNLSATSFVVGTPFFIQVSGDNTMKLKTSNETNPGALYAPRFAEEDEPAIYEVRLTNGNQYDALFICADENASEQYETGKDLIKLFGNNTNAYIWSEDYGQKLCAQNAKKWSNETYFSVVLSAPKQGRYTLSASEGDDSVYLILDDGTKQELSQPYDLFLKKGNNYVTLCIGENASVVPTDIFNVEVENEVQKVLYNDVIYIVRGGVVYNTQGVRVK